MTSIRLVNNNPLSRLHSVIYYLKKDDYISNTIDTTAITGHYYADRRLDTSHDNGIN